MKKLILIAICFFFFLNARTQDKLPSFGKVDKAELEMKECDFDPGVEALVLFNVGEIEFSYSNNVGWVSESVYRVRIKILKAKAVERAQIKIRFYTKNKVQEISGVTGISFNLDANGNIEESKLEDKSIYEKVIDKEYSEVSFALPNVKTGTVFEYRYKMLRKSYSYIPSWNFQQSIPVKYSAYNITIPEYFQFTVLVTKRQEMEKAPSNAIKEGTWYMMHNIPGLKEEPYSSGTNDYLQRIEFQLSRIEAPSFYEDVRTTWPKIIDELMLDDEFGRELRKNIKGADDLHQQVISIQSVKERIRAVYNYVQSNMLWDEEYGIYTDKGVKDAWDKKSGNITDINFILIRLLKDADIDAKPLLISTKDNGYVNPFFPFLKRFNAVMVYVKDGDDVYVMNAADKYNPFNLVPYDVINTNALVVDKGSNVLVVLSGKNKFYNNIFFTCSVEPDGKLTGQALMNSSGYARNIRMQTINKKRLKEAFEDNGGINIKVDSITINNDKDEMEPLEQKVNFSGYLQTGGEYLFLPYNLFMGMGKNPFIEENRVMDIDFSFPKSYVVTGTYYLPENFVIDVLPKNTKMIMPDTSIVLTRVMQKEGNIISFRFTLDVKVEGYTADSYPYVKEFFKKMYAILDERIVLKKN